MERSNRSIQFYVRKTDKNLIEIVEAYDIGKIKIGFRTYSANAEAGSKVDNKVDFYLSMEDFELLCQNLLSGNIIKRVQKGENIEPLYRGSARGGEFFARTLSITKSNKGIFITATEGPGKKTEKGTAQPLYKLNEAPERVSIALNSDEIKTFALQGKRALDVFYMRVAMGTLVMGGETSNQSDDTFPGNYPEQQIA